MRHHRRSENSFACLRSTTSNCCAQLFQNSSLSFLSLYAPAIYSPPTNSRTNSFFPSILYSSRNVSILGNVNCHHSLWDSKGSSDPRGEEVFDWVISSDFLPLNNPDISTLPRRFSSSGYSPDIFFAPFSLALSCSWKVLQDLASGHLPILLTIPLSLLFRPNERHPSSIFRKLVGMTFYCDSHCSSAEEYLSLSSAAALFTSLALNAAKSFTSFDRIKRHPKARWSAEVEDAVSERSKTRSSDSIKALV